MMPSPRANRQRRAFQPTQTPGRLVKTTPPELWTVAINASILQNFYLLYNPENAVESRCSLILKHYEGRTDELAHDLSRRYGPAAQRWLRAQSILRNPLRMPKRWSRGKDAEP